MTLFFTLCAVVAKNEACDCRISDSTCNGASSNASRNQTTKKQDIGNIGDVIVAKDIQEEVFSEPDSMVSNFRHF